MIYFPNAESYEKIYTEAKEDARLFELCWMLCANKVLSFFDHNENDTILTSYLLDPALKKPNLCFGRISNIYLKPSTGDESAKIYTSCFKNTIIDYRKSSLFYQIFDMWKNQNPHYVAEQFVPADFKEYKFYKRANCSTYYLLVSNTEASRHLPKSDISQWGLGAYHRSEGKVAFCPNFIQTFFDEQTHEIDWPDVDPYYKKEFLRCLNEYNMFIPEYMKG